MYFPALYGCSWCMGKQKFPVDPLVDGRVAAPKKKQYYCDSEILC